MGIATSAGITSGIDYAALLKGLVQVKRQPISQLQTRLKALEATNKSYEDLGGRLSALQSAADEFKLASELIGFTVEGSNSSILTATATSSASEGTYEVVVQTLAQAHKIAADGVAEESTTLTGGLFKFTVAGGAEESITITGGVTTLAGLRDEINNLDAGVTATIINDGSATDPYRLILTSNETGASNDIAITQNDTGLNFSTTLQAAQDSVITVDSLSISRSSNTINDVITGVTLDLKSTDAAETVILTLTNDTEDIADKVEALVSAYNAVALHIKSNNRFNSETKTAQPLYGEAAARTMLSSLRSLLGSQVAALPDTMNRLIHVGIETEAGLLKFDRDDFNDAIAADFDGVIDLFVEDIASGTKGFAVLLSDKVDNLNDYASGQLTLKRKGLDLSIKNLTKEIEKDEDALAVYEERLRMDFVGLEMLLTSLKSQSGFLGSL